MSKSEDSKPNNYQEKQNIYNTTLQINMREREREREREGTLERIIHDYNYWNQKDLEPREIYDYTTEKYK